MAVLPTSSSDSTSSDSSSDTSESDAPPSKKPRTTPAPRSNDSKKKATVAAAAAGEEEEDTEKQPFQRVFTEEDEIVLLEGLFKYLKENSGDDDGHGGAINMVGFHAYIKESIHTEITKAQLSDKIKRLKRRFRNNQDRVFKQDSHEKHVFELCSKIWCVKEPAGKHVPDPPINPLSPPSLCNLFDAGFEDYHAMLRVFGSFMDGAIGGCESGSILKEKLMRLRVAHYELMIRHNLLRNEKIQLIIDSIK
ncbi:hypothetical protein V6N13_030634 [Hibiscus sabdariffa]|uniref:Glabrous enhancer-binding protein-like DBD domain-containing protein n=1 Tax=Hibiscus sabdariffa TaxID=183260 RepID=A0ABR2D5S6_9ROSI